MAVTPEIVEAFARLVHAVADVGRLVVEAEVGFTAVVDYNTGPVEMAVGPKVERRCVVRYSFVAASVVTAMGSPFGAVLVACTSELSSFGCFVQTLKPFSKDTKVEIEIISDGAMFITEGKVAYATTYGMGVVFTNVARLHQILLDEWLADETLQ